MNKAILIDAVNQTVEETTINIWSEIAPKIGCQLFDCIDIDDKNTLYVDDEGLLKPQEHFFVIEGYPLPQPKAGLIIGRDQNGDRKDTSLTVEQVKAKVRFIPRELIASEGRDLLL